MANTSRNRPASQSPAFDEPGFRQSLAKLLADLPAHGLVVAYSGGVDSRVLLHLCQRFASHSGRRLRALHVNHGLQQQADRWQQHCEQYCEAASIELQCQAVDATAASGDSPEATARAARYAALFEALADDEILLLGHHADDQAETVLLQLLRGAGAAGLSGMAQRQQRRYQGRSITLCRPLLTHSREQLVAYASEQGLAWVEDPSNSDTDIRRNALRQQVFPLLKQHWPEVNKSLAQVAMQQQQSAVLLDELANQDLALCVTDSPQQLDVAGLRTLGVERQFNLLRFWLHQRDSRPNRKCLQQIITDIIPAREDAAAMVRWGEYEMRRFDGRLFLMSRSDKTTQARLELSWSPREPVPLQASGQLLQAQTGVECGLDLRYLDETLTVRYRRGGERLVVQGSAHHQAVKKLLQASRIPPWERSRIPLLYHGEDLLAVGSLWLAAPHCVASGNVGWAPRFTIA